MAPVGHITAHARSAHALRARPRFGQRLTHGAPAQQAHAHREPEALIAAACLAGLPITLLVGAIVQAMS